MELNITALIKDLNPELFFSSVMKMGENAAEITWENAKQESSKHSYLLGSEEKLQAYKEHVLSFGSWDEEEIDSWTLEEKVALLIQMVSAELEEQENHRVFQDEEQIEWYYLMD